ncbi:MAG: hypothetical protein ACKOCA_09735 [Vulcanococcus sp.]|nr:hypothetical protein [Cyanobacteria bacterium REEB498]GDX73107.1 hypothetical protein LBMAG39_15400 [Cyanobium sp.]
MRYSVVCRLEHGGYRSECDQEDLPSAIRLSLSRARQTRQRHYILDELGKIVDIVHPQLISQPLSSTVLG